MTILTISFSPADETAVFGCFSQPLSLPEAQGYPFPGPIHVVLCPDIPPACNKPDAPTVQAIGTGSGGSGTAPTEVLLSSYAGDGSSPFKYVVWEAEVRETDVFSDLWTHYSNDSVLYSTGNTYEFRATGLKSGLDHRFRVGYCRKTISATGCSCWSDWSYQTVAFSWPPLQVALPEPLVLTREVEDHFEGPATRPKRTPTGEIPNNCPGTEDRCFGDGMGTDAVWMDDFFSFAGNGAHIAEDAGEHFLYLPTNAIAKYAASQSTHSHSWAEIEFRALNPAAEYRIDISAREFLDLYSPPGGNPVVTLHAYVVQLRKEGPLTPAPKMFIYRALGVGLVIGESLVTNMSGTGCSDVSGLLASGEPALLRIEVTDDPDLQRPIVTGTVAWDCEGTSCAKQCTLETIDTQIEGSELYNKNGGWKIQSHHMPHRVDVFRAGSEAL